MMVFVYRFFVVLCLSGILLEVSHGSSVQHTKIVKQLELLYDTLGKKICSNSL
jgi:hypothetical protein